jgi:hypothetical protein
MDSLADRTRTARSTKIVKIDGVRRVRNDELERTGWIGSREGIEGKDELRWDRRLGR